MLYLNSFYPIQKFRLFAVFLLCFLSFQSISWAVDSPSDQYPLEDDWWLPDWVTTSSNSGFYHTNNTADATGIKIPWKEVNPSEGVYDWTYIEKQAKAASTDKLWVRFFASDVNHVPSWVIKKYNIPSYRYLWPDSPYYDINYQINSEGNFIPIWNTNVQNEYRKMLHALAKHKLATSGRIVFAYIPHGWRWSEYSFKWLTEKIKNGTTPQEFLDWFSVMLEDYATVFRGDYGKLVYTGRGEAEWMEWAPARIGWTNAKYSPYWNAWNDAINSADGGSVLSDMVIKKGGGARDGFTEQFNRYGNIPDWGTTLITYDDGYRYSVVDDTNPLIADKSRVFATENEDFSSLWKPVSSFDKYYYWKMAHLCALKLRMNWIFPKWNEAAERPKLTAWLKLSLGKKAAESPDAWVALRQYFPGKGDKKDNVRNFERWLTHRNVRPDGMTKPTYRIDYPASYAKSLNGNSDTSAWSYEALRTDIASGSKYMYFSVDDDFMSPGSHRVQIKVTWRDDAVGTWHVDYDAADGSIYKRCNVSAKGDGKWKTSTLTIKDAGFANRQVSGNDFRLVSDGQTDLVVRFVRVIRLDPPTDQKILTPPSKLRVLN